MWERNMGPLPPLCTLPGDWARSLFGVQYNAPANRATGPGCSDELLFVNVLYVYLKIIRFSNIIVTFNIYDTS